MKQLKTFKGYVSENLDPEEVERLSTMGLKTKLDEDEVFDTVRDHLMDDAEVGRLWAELEARLKTLCAEFKEQYEYSEDSLYSAAEQLREYGQDNYDSFETLISDAVWNNLID